ncbi:MAG TPA: cytochrome c3 family protein [Candidatus Paceibacterota bacterium]|nr:cytochrome c3 family protein [Candidatus Paceibacterota bacterium]
MSNNRIIVIIAALGMAAGTFSANAAIQGSKHDMSGKGWGTTELCKFCHTPHLSQNVVGAPLWNHASTVQTYTLYSSASFVGASTQTQPGPQSKLCLSCHDGTVAIDSYANGGINRVGTQFITSTNKVGGNGSLGNDHPIAFTYNAALAASAKHLNTPASTSWADAAQTLPLYAGKMECATCHSVHDNTYTKFMRVSNAGSAMCITCHTY